MVSSRSSRRLTTWSSIRRSLHRVNPVTRGTRWASFFWVQSMVRDNGNRALLHRFDQSITLARADLGDKHPAVLGLTSTFHNLLRKWADV